MVLGASSDDNDGYLNLDLPKNKASEMKLDTLTKLQKFGYSVGHFQNDLTAGCWFNYILYFMESVVFKGEPGSCYYAGYIS